MTPQQAQDAVAFLFTMQHQGEFIFDHKRERWFIQRGDYWEKCKHYASQRVRELTAMVNPSMVSPEFHDAVERRLKAAPEFSKSLDRAWGESWLKRCTRPVKNDARHPRELPRRSRLYKSFYRWVDDHAGDPASVERWGKEVMAGFERMRGYRGYRYRGLALVIGE